MPLTAAEPSPTTWKDDAMMMSPQNQRRIVIALVILIGGAMVLSLVVSPGMLGVQGPGLG
jgi:hypothetical protein